MSPTFLIKFKICNTEVGKQRYSNPVLVFIVSIYIFIYRYISKFDESSKFNVNTDLVLNVRFENIPHIK